MWVVAIALGSASLEHLSRAARSWGDYSRSWILIVFCMVLDPRFYARWCLVSPCYLTGISDDRKRKRMEVWSSHQNSKLGLWDLEGKIILIKCYSHYVISQVCSINMYWIFLKFYCIFWVHHNFSHIVG